MDNRGDKQYSENEVLETCMLASLLSSLLTFGFFGFCCLAGFSGGKAFIMTISILPVPAGIVASIHSANESKTGYRDRLGEVRFSARRLLSEAFTFLYGIL